MNLGNSTTAAFLLGHNAVQSALYCSPDQTLARRLYRANHPTEVAALKCMDGRLHLPVMADMPSGIIQPFRNIGGQFRIGWPYFGMLMLDWVQYAVSRGRHSLLFITYHWSKGEKHRGCRGFNYDLAAARAYVSDFRKEFESVYGDKHTTVYPIRLGVETDEDAFFIHGDNGEVLDLSECVGSSEGEIQAILQRMFPDMHQQIHQDLLPILMGNLRHIKRVRDGHRPITEVEHRENVVAVGRGFGWLHLPNRALIIGPFAPDLNGPIATAGGIVEENIRKGRTNSGESPLLLASAVYRGEAGPERLWAMQKARILADHAWGILSQNKALVGLDALIGVVDLDTQKFTQIDWEPSRP